MIRRSVDFPQPDGPIRETNSRGATSRSMSSSAVTPVRNDFVSPWIETTFAPGSLEPAPAPTEPAPALTGRLGRAQGSCDVHRRAMEQEALGERDEPEEDEPERGADEVGRPERGGLE